MTYGKFAPFIHTDRTVSYMEASFLIALLPMVSYAVFKYGLRALILILSSALLNVLFCMLFTKGTRNAQKIRLYNVTSGIVFALMLPPDTSLIIVIAANAFMALASDVLFGGVAFLPFNNPVAARILVELMWPEHLKGFTEAGRRWFSLSSLISFSKTTTSVASQVEDYHTAELFTDGYPSYIGMCSLMIILIGVAYLIHSKTVRTAAPICYLVTVILLRVATHFKDGLKANVTFILVSGIFFVAFFLLTDRATIPQNHLGGTVTGIICGILTAGAFQLTDGILALCVPVIAVNLISGMIEYLTSDASERHEVAKEEA